MARRSADLTASEERRFLDDLDIVCDLIGAHPAVTGVAIVGDPLDSRLVVDALGALAHAFEDVVSANAALRIVTEDIGHAELVRRVRLVRHSTRA